MYSPVRHSHSAMDRSPTKAEDNPCVVRQYQTCTASCLPPSCRRSACPAPARTQDIQLKGSIKNTKMEKSRKEQKTALPPSLESCTERQRETGNSPSPCICSDGSLPIFLPSPGGSQKVPLAVTQTPPAHAVAGGRRVAALRSDHSTGWH